MQRLLGATTTIGGVAIATGIAVEFCTYDGKNILHNKFNAHIFGILLFDTFVFLAVDAGNRVVLFDKLRGMKVVGEGTHFKIPFLQVSLQKFKYKGKCSEVITTLFHQVPIHMDIRSRPRSIHSVTGTKDLQMVSS